MKRYKSEELTINYHPDDLESKQCLSPSNSTLLSYALELVEL
jgi:hypothetical protein